MKRKLETQQRNEKRKKAESIEDSGLEADLTGNYFLEALFLIGNGTISIGVYQL